MLSVRRSHIYILLALGLTTTTLLGQTKSRKVRTLERQRSEMQSKIKRTEVELSRIRQSSAAEQQRLKLIAQQVAQRQQMIALIGEEITALERQIDSLGGEMARLRTRERHLLEQYVRSLKAMQQRDTSSDQLLFVFSASSLDEAMLRQRFLSGYAIATSRATSEIKETRRGIEQVQAEVNASHEQKSKLLELRTSERQALEQEASKRKAQVATLRGTEQKLSKSLESQRRQAQQLEAQIQRQIATEMAAAEERARKERERARTKQAQSAKPTRGKASGTSAPDTSGGSASHATEDDSSQPKKSKSAVSGGYAMNAEERKLSGSFAQNRGRLPMPVRGRYDLVRRFGLQQHDEHARVQVSSGGIDLRVYADKSAYVVFDGVVSSVFVTPGYGQSVIIRHGNYLTVYANLSSVRVSRGQRVKMGQTLGTISSAGDVHRANILHFQLWHERSKLNPERWVKRS